MTELGNTGRQVSRLALGAMQMGNATSEPDSVRILDKYLDAGGNFIDTANCYEWWARPGSLGGHSEELLGRWMRAGGHRDRIFLATKAGAVPRYSGKLWDADGNPDWDLAWQTFEGAGAETLTKALDDSLRRLGTDHVDLYYVHVDDRKTPLEETLEALAGLVKAGKVLHLGWSNVRTWRLERVRQICRREGWPLPVAVQQEYTYLRPTGDGFSLVPGEMLDYLGEHPDQTLVAYSPILKGGYDDPARRTGVWANYEGTANAERLKRLAEVAAGTGLTPNQLVLAWMMRSESPKAIPIAGPRTVEQFDAILPALTAGPIDL
jgi:aryl-alcohol dehydrogenase-like predicted oxidoreductase